MRAQEAETLQAEVQTLGAEAARLQRELDTKADMEVQLAQRGSLQARPRSALLAGLHSALAD